MDGLKWNNQRAPDFMRQNMFYNGWTHSHYITNIIVFCPDGTILIMCYNAPGMMNDSSVAHAGNVYRKLEDLYYNHGFKCVVDSAFSKQEFPFLIKSSQLDLDDNEMLVVNCIATSLRLSAEWGMGELHATFPRMKETFRYHEGGERKVGLKLMLHLFNYRSRRVGINQLLSTYMPRLNDTRDNIIQQ